MIQSEVIDSLVELFESIDNGKTEEESIFDKNGDEILNVNREFEPFDKSARVRFGYWFELHSIPSPSVQKELGKNGMNEWKGLFQINVCVYKNTPDIQNVFDTTYAAIAGVMKRGVFYKNVRIKKVYNSSAIDHDDYYAMPVTVEWWANLAN